MDYFFGNKLSDSLLKLEDDEKVHCFKVLRKKEGDVIGVIDGKGGAWFAMILDHSAQTNELNIVSDVLLADTPDKNYYLHVAVAPPKSSEKMEWFVEKAVESGVDTITLLFTKRTERKNFNTEKLQKIARAALKQSKQRVLPMIQSLSFDVFLKQENAQYKYIASCENAADSVLLSSIANAQSCCVCIGPEGDFTPEEYALARLHGFVPLTLGMQRFKTETAALLVVMAKLAYSS